MTVERDTVENPRRGIIMRLASMACYSAMAALAKLAAKSGIPFVELLFFRNLFALLPVLGYVAWRRQPVLLTTKRPMAHLTRSVIGTFSMAFVFLGVINLPLNEATAISFSTPLVATILSALFLKEHVGPHRWLAILVGFAGVLVIVRPDPGSMVAIGAIYALIGVLFSSAVNVTIRQIASTEAGVTIAFYFMSLSAIPLGMALPFFWKTPDAAQWLLLIGLGVSGGLAQLAMNVSLRYAPVSTLVSFDYSQIVWAGLLAWVLWDELPGPDTLTGVAIIAASGLYIIYRERKKARPPRLTASAVEES